MARLPVQKKHPGILFNETYLAPLDLSAKDAASIMGVDKDYVEKFIIGEAKVNESLAARIAEDFGSTKAWWLKIQRKYDERK